MLTSVSVSPYGPSAATLPGNWIFDRCGSMSAYSGQRDHALIGNNGHESAEYALDLAEKLPHTAKRR